jgi:oligopeptide/dipeptide ABC transporter ATP-binding protein
LVPPTSGEIWFEGANILSLDKATSKRVRRDIQIVFQDPVNSLNPRFKVRDIVLEGRRIQGLPCNPELVDDILLKVGLGPEFADRYPNELSGGQRQRVGIARTLVLRPKLIVADEPVSALDVSIQAQVINLLVKLRGELGLTYIVIAHNLAVVGYIADRIAVMYLGKIIELAPSERIYRNALHPYTVALRSAIPDVAAGNRQGRLRLAGEVPSPIDPPSGCRFRTRCPIASEICATSEPALEAKGGEHMVACHFAGELQSRRKARGWTSASPTGDSAAAVPHQ